MKKIHRKGKRFFAPTVAAGFLLAMALTFNACGSDDNGDPNTGTSSPSTDDGSSSSKQDITLSSSSTGSSTDDGSSSSKQDITSSSSNGSSSSDGSVNYTDKGNSIASYERIEIGDQVWMAENLNYKVAGSKCYGEGNSSYSSSEVQSNCDTYGRLYDWATAMALPSKCNSILSTSDADCAIGTKHRGICPSGWHIPSNEDWNELYHYADGTLNGSTNLSSDYNSPAAGKYLKATSGWNSYSGIVNLDSYGFSALPGGYGNSDGGFNDVGNYGVWWSASEYSSYVAYYRYMVYDIEYAFYSDNDKSSLFSVRCLQD